MSTLLFLLTVFLITIDIVSLSYLVGKAIEVNTSDYLLLQKIIVNIGLLMVSCITLAFSELTISWGAIHIGICYNSYLVVKLLKRKYYHLL